MATNLLDIVKPYIPKELLKKGFISNPDLIALGKRDFIKTETGSVAPFANLFGIPRVSYEYLSILSYIDSLKFSNGSEITIHLLSKSLSYGALFAFVKFNGSNKVTVHAPQGAEVVKPKIELANDLIMQFDKAVIKESVSPSLKKRQKTIDLVFCNASNEAELISATKLFSQSSRGILIIKGYAVSGNPLALDVMIEDGSLPYCHIAGFGSLIKF